MLCCTRACFSRANTKKPPYIRACGGLVFCETRGAITRGAALCTRAGEQRARSERQNSASRGATRSLMRSLYFSGRASRQVVVSSDGK